MPRGSLVLIFCLGAVLLGGVVGSRASVRAQSTIGIIPKPPYEVGASHASFDLVNVGDRVTTLWLEYGPTTAYGERAMIGIGAWDPKTHITLFNLVPGTLYHYRFVVEDVITGETVEYPDSTLRTLPPAPPAVSKLKIKAGVRRIDISGFVRTGGYDTHLSVAGIYWTVLAWHGDTEKPGYSSYFNYSLSRPPGRYTILLIAQNPLGVMQKIKSVTVKN